MHLLLALIVQYRLLYVVFFAPKSDTILHLWVTMRGCIVQLPVDTHKHSRESQETLPDSFLQNHNLVSSFT